MANRIVPTLQEILYRLSSAATNASLKAPVSENPGRFPVVVRPETRAFLEAQAEYLGGSIAGVAGAILDGVAMATQGKDGAVSSLRGVSERFGILLKEHDLSAPAAAEALSDLGFSLADFASQEALQLKLTSSTIRDVAARFHIGYDWLAGKTDEVFRSEPGTWYKAMTEAADQLVLAKQSSMQTELSICISEHADLNITDDNQAEEKLPHFIPVLIRTQQLPGQEVLETYEVWEEGRWSYSRCREHIKLVIYFAQRLGTYVTGRTLTQNEYSLLSRGQVLPATILRRNSRVSWHPDDYVTPNSPVSKEAGEWSAITSNEDYKADFSHFNQLLTQGAST